MSKKTTYTLANLKDAFSQTNKLLATISHTRMTLISVAVLGSYGEAKLEGDTITQKQASELFDVSKSYVSQCVKVARYIIDNDIVSIVNENSDRFDLAKMYKALSDIESVDEFIEYFDLKRPTVETEAETEAEAEAEAEAEVEVEADDNDNDNEVEVEVEDYVEIDANDVVHISLNGLIYRIPMDVLKEYKA